MTLNDFANLSVILTGYPITTILPQLDTQHQAQELLDFLNAQNIGDAMDALDATWQRAQNGDKVQNVKELIVDNPQLGPLAQRIIMLWYLGVWYKNITVPLNSGMFVDEVVSGSAYKNGLAWGTIGAHPMGYSEENFGYWNTVPPVLNPQPSN